MALSPETIREEREKIAQITVKGTITSADLVERNSECLHTYESIVDTGDEQVVFHYKVLAQQCTTDSIFDIEQQPFALGTQVRLRLTEEEPHEMVSSDVLFYASQDSDSPVDDTTVASVSDGGLVPVVVVCFAVGLVFGMGVMRFFKKTK